MVQDTAGVPCAHGSRRAAPLSRYPPLTAPRTPIVPSVAWKGKSGLGDYADFVMQTDAIVGDVLAAEGFTDSYLYSSGRTRGDRH